MRQGGGQMSAVTRTIGALSLFLALETAAVGASFDGAVLDPAAPQTQVTVEPLPPALADTVAPTKDGRLVVLTHRDLNSGVNDDSFNRIFDDQNDGAAEFCSIGEF